MTDDAQPNLPYRQELIEIGARADAGRLEALKRQAAAAAAALLAEPGADAAPILALPERREDLGEIVERAEALAKLVGEVAVLGTGGSSLGGQTLLALADRGYGPKLGRPTVRFFDNVDPDLLGLYAARLDARSAGLVIISKSGGTLETLAQALALLPPYLELPVVERAKRVLVITEAPDSPLGQLAQRHGLTLLPHEPQLGGRFTALSSVGLLPAALGGLDIGAVRSGAAAVMAALRGQGTEAPPVVGAALAALWMEQGYGQQVLMPYCDRLATFALWYRQLWAESLGKEGRGQTPIRAVGAVDQHSQLQLYLEGPQDKAFSLVQLQSRGVGLALDPALIGDPALDYLAGRRLGDLLLAEARATADSIAAAGLPLRVFHLAQPDEAALGGLFQHFMLETLLTAELIGVSAFGQPAVESGKAAARRYLREMAS